MAAEIPLRRNGKLLADFGETLKKTAKWQLSSSIYRGFTGAI
jgi:hypothetical protein